MSRKGGRRSFWRTYGAFHGVRLPYSQEVDDNPDHWTCPDCGGPLVDRSDLGRDGWLPMSELRAAGIPDLDEAWARRRAGGSGKGGGCDFNGLRGGDRSFRKKDGV